MARALHLAAGLAVLAWGTGLTAVEATGGDARGTKAPSGDTAGEARNATSWTDWRFEVGADGSIGVGYLSGDGVRRQTGATTLLRAGARPVLAVGDLELGSDLDLAYRETFGADLTELKGEANLGLRYRPLRAFRATLLGGLKGAWRPDWPDVYQPLTDGGLGKTDRYSHLDRYVRVKLAAIPARHHHLRLDYRYFLADYRQDKNFDPIDTPNHLTPFDGHQHEVGLSWRWLKGWWSLGLSAAYIWQRSFFLFARDAGTGVTHAGPGGAPPNPLQIIQGFEPGATAKFKFLKGKVKLRLGYDLEIIEDTFQGYYSYLGHRPSAKLWLELPARIRLELGLGASLRRYGADSYATGTNHPPLEWGDRRQDYRLRGSLLASIRIYRNLRAYVSGRLRLRWTNFPDYEPGTFPASRAYDIDWDYRDTRLLAGLTYRL